MSADRLRFGSNKVIRYCIVCEHWWEDRHQRSCPNCMAPEQQVSSVVGGSVEAILDAIHREAPWIGWADRE